MHYQNFTISFRYHNKSVDHDSRINLQNCSLRMCARPGLHISLHSCIFYCVDLQSRWSGMVLIYDRLWKVRAVSFFSAMKLDVKFNRIGIPTQI